MSSNNTFIPTTKDTVKDVIDNFKTEKQESSQTENENTKSNISDTDIALNKLTSLNKSGSSSGNET